MCEYGRRRPHGRSLGRRNNYHLFIFEPLLVELLTLERKAQSINLMQR